MLTLSSVLFSQGWVGLDGGAICRQGVGYLQGKTDVGVRRSEGEPLRIDSPALIGGGPLVTSVGQLGAGPEGMLPSCPKALSPLGLVGGWLRRELISPIW